MLANENSSPIGKPQAIPYCEEMYNANLCINEKTCLLHMGKQRHRSAAQDFTMQVYCSLAISKIFKPLASFLAVHGHSGLNWTRLKPLNQVFS